MISDDLPVFAPMDSGFGESGLVTRADVVSEARSWLGTSYVHQHRAKGVAVDCAGLVIGVMRELHLCAPDFDVTAYPRRPDGKTLLLLCDRFMRRIHTQDLRPGNVLVLAFRAEPQHLGIVGDYLYGGLSLIHALGTTDGKGSVVEWALTQRKGFRAVQAYSIIGVSD